MKKLFALLMVGTALTAFVGCGSKEEAPATTPVATEAPAATETPAVTEAPAAEGAITAEGEVDERGWQPVVTITKDGDKIATVDFDYVNKDGAKKSEDAEYNKNMAEKAGTDVKTAIETLEAQLIEKQDVTAIDTVAGATGTTEDFKAIVTEALAK